MKLPELLERQFVLPSIPKVVALLLTELGRPDVDLRKVTRLISTDPALTTRLLQLANSGHFKRGFHQGRTRHPSGPFLGL